MVYLDPLAPGESVVARGGEDGSLVTCTNKVILAQGNTDVKLGPKAAKHREEAHARRGVAFGFFGQHQLLCTNLCCNRCFLITLSPD